MREKKMDHSSCWRKLQQASFIPLNMVHSNLLVYCPLLKHVSLFFTWAVERLGQFSGHDLDDETNTEPEHLTEQAGLGPDGHSQVHHNLLEEGNRLGTRIEGKNPWRAEHVTHLSEYGHADVAVTGIIDEGRELVWRNGSSDGFLSRLRRQTHCEVLLVGQQIWAGLRGDQPIRKRNLQSSHN